MAVTFLLLALPLGAWSQSVTSCGAAGDHMTGVKITVSPDPIAKGKPFTIDFSGNLDADLGAMNVDADLTVKAFDVISKAVKTSAPITMSPGLVAGAQTVSIGPLTLPSLPGSLEADGTIKITNGKKEPVACIKLALNVPAMGKEEVAATSGELDAADQGSKLSVCSAASDHLHNLTISSTAGVSTVTGSLDEAVTKFVANLALKLKIGWLSHTIDMAIPVSCSPGLVKGPLKLTAGPASPSLISDSKSLIDVTVTGTVKIDDAASQEIACLSIDPSSDLQPAKELKGIPDIIEKLACEFATKPEMEDKAVGDICRKIVSTNGWEEKFCEKELDAVWDKVVAHCPKLQAVVVTERDIPGMIEKAICKYATEKDIEKGAVDEICEKVCTGKLSVFTPVCEKLLTKDWDQVMKSCPKPAIVV